MKSNKPGAPNIVLDLSIKNALEKRAQLNPEHEAILPWWFKRYTHLEYGRDAMQAYEYVMRWLQDNAPEEAENVYDEGDMTQNIIINPMIVVADDVMQAFMDAGFKVMEEKDIPGNEITDLSERLKHGSDFNTQWH